MANDGETSDRPIEPHDEEPDPDSQDAGDDEGDEPLTPELKADELPAH